jgi:hypothetical protein
MIQGNMHSYKNGGREYHISLIQAQKSKRIAFFNILLLLFFFKNSNLILKK